MNKILTKVEALPDYELLLTYNNNEIRKLDMKFYLDFGVFSELKDFSIFQTVHLSFDTIQWDNDLDLDPEFLYTHSLLVDENVQKRA